MPPSSLCDLNSNHHSGEGENGFRAITVALTLGRGVGGGDGQQVKTITDRFPTWESKSKGSRTDMTI